MEEILHFHNHISLLFPTLLKQTYDLTFISVSRNKESSLMLLQWSIFRNVYASHKSITFNIAFDCDAF